MKNVRARSIAIQTRRTKLRSGFGRSMDSVVVVLTVVISSVTLGPRTCDYMWRVMLEPTKVETCLVVIHMFFRSCVASTKWALSGKRRSRKETRSQQLWMFNHEVKARLTCRECAEKDGRDGDRFAGAPGRLFDCIRASIARATLPNKTLALLVVKVALLHKMMIS